MKIAFLTPEFPHPRTGISGGIGTSIKNLSDGLIDAGHEVVILVYGQEKDEVFEEGELTFHRIKNARLKGLSWWLTRKKIEKKINGLYTEKKIDLVEAPDWTGISSFVNSKCPLIVRLHGSDTYFCHLEKRPVKWFTHWHEQRALQKADALVSVSRYTANVTNELFSLHRKFTIIPNGVDSQKFEVLENDTYESNPQILYFGTLIRKKGLLELPYIFNEVHKQNPSAELILVGRDAADVVTGNSSTWEMMKPLFTEEAFAKVNYFGSVGYEEIKALIQKAEVCVFPTFAEALPVSWLEAMAMRKPLVASDIGWAEEIVENGRNGFLVHPKSHNEFAKKISLLLENEEMRNKMGNEARQRVMEKFDIGIVASENVAFYSSLLKD
jgi:glycosyltransferase involved in cell wall biosynthesis